MRELSNVTSGWLFTSGVFPEGKKEAIDFNENFFKEYVAGGWLINKPHAIEEYLENPDARIDANYREGIFLITAAREKDLRTLKLLFERSIKEINKEFLLDALSCAADNGDIPCADFLINQGANPDKLKGIAAYSNYKHMEAFLNTKVKGATSNDHFIYEYVYGNKDKAMTYLNNIDIDIDININYKNGRFLQEAVQQGDVRIVELLLKKGANVGVERAVDIATRNKDNACLELLTAYRAVAN